MKNTIQGIIAAGAIGAAGLVAGCEDNHGATAQLRSTIDTAKDNAAVQVILDSTVSLLQSTYLKPIGADPGEPMFNFQESRAAIVGALSREHGAREIVADKFKITTQFPDAADSFSVAVAKIVDAQPGDNRQAIRAQITETLSGIVNEAKELADSRKNHVYR